MSPSSEARHQQTASDVKRLGVGAGVAVAGRLGGRGVQFAVQAFLATTLGPAAFGLYALGWTALRFVGLLATLGLQNAVVHFASAEWRRSPATVRSVTGKALWTGLVFGALVGVAFFFASDTLALSIFGKPAMAPVFRLVACALPFVVASQIVAASTRASKRVVFSVLSEDLGQPTVNLLALAVLIGLFGYGLRGATLALPVSFGASFLIGLAFLRRLLAQRAGAETEPRRRLPLRELLRYSVPTALAGALGSYVIWIDRLFVGYFRPAAELGIYQASSQLTLPFAVVLAAFNIVFAPMVVDLYAKGRHERLQELFRVSTKWGLYLCLPAFVLLLGAGRPLIGLLFGQGYSAGYPIVVILSIGQLVNVGTGAVGILLIMTGNQRRWLLITALAVAANIALSCWLVPSHGAEGAAVATSLAMGGMFLAGLVTTRRILSLWPYDPRYLKGALATAVAGAALLGLRELAPPDSLALLVLGAVVVPALFALSLAAAGFDSEDRLLLDLLRSRLGRPRG